VVPLRRGAPAPSDFFTPNPGETRIVTGRLADKSGSPRPGTVPYKDNIITLHLVDVQDRSNGERLGSALVYAWGMIDNRRTPIARARKGQRLELELTNWLDVEHRYGTYRRSALPDTGLELEAPAWGQIPAQP
jgi:hypothetical protein